MFALTDYDYTLPEELVAQFPAADRDGARLLVMDRETGSLAHHSFLQLPDLLRADDILVVNNTEVVPGRLFGSKETGGKVELLIIDYAGRQRNGLSNGSILCECLIKASKRPKPGTRLRFKGGLDGEVVRFVDGVFTVRFFCDDPFEDLLYRSGQVPLPPYIRRSAEGKDTVSYQTVYASQKGAVAAPTAGLHFSNRLMDALGQKGIDIVEITLHVGYGTFLPVREADIRRHVLHPERYELTDAAASALNTGRAAGGRIVAVGTTSVRTLEFCADPDGTLKGGSGVCDLFIYPGFRFKSVDAIITNFHLPQSTLLMLISAFAGRDHVFRAYREAVEQRYRFYSYGDAMLIR